MARSFCQDVSKQCHGVTCEFCQLPEGIETAYFCCFEAGHDGPHYNRDAAFEQPAIVWENEL